MATKKASEKKYGPKASENVEREMKAMKAGKLKSGSGQKVTNPKQAIAIALSEARKSGGKVPPAKKLAAKKIGAKGSAAKNAVPQKSATKKSTVSKIPAKKSTAKKSVATKAPAKKSAAKKSTAKKTSR
jgi:hypothetical protein